MPGLVLEVRESDLEARRREILDELGLGDYVVFLERERLGLLSDLEWSRVDELRGIAFLLGEDE